ncbi:Uu.00g054570.m01.CDS01 [Anthostomella pinea]|uniref:Uu.00g054570.m01.CDS01 n=1 Tax=Anthostomella pinea TaxID=933095 RepID=A0AAI8VWL8_9PEZI|nr:Uu.00g054570.m01.CDS01 [Anthostomella pinea]
MHATTHLPHTFALAATATATTFTLSNPPAIGTNLQTENTRPCGGFVVTPEATFVDYPIAGHDIKATNTSDASQRSAFDFRVALLSDPTLSFIALYGTQYSQDSDTACWPSVPGKDIESWVGQDAVLQVAHALPSVSSGAPRPRLSAAPGTFPSADECHLLARCGTVLLPQIPLADIIVAEIFVAGTTIPGTPISEIPIAEICIAETTFAGIPIARAVTPRPITTGPVIANVHTTGAASNAERTGTAPTKTPATAGTTRTTTTEITTPKTAAARISAARVSTIAGPHAQYATASFRACPVKVMLDEGGQYLCNRADILEHLPNTRQAPFGRTLEPRIAVQNQIPAALEALHQLFRGLEQYRTTGTPLYMFERARAMLNRDTEYAWYQCFDFFVGTCAALDSEFGLGCSEELLQQIDEFAIDLMYTHELGTLDHRNPLLDFFVAYAKVFQPTTPRHLDTLRELWNCVPAEPRAWLMVDLAQVMDWRAQRSNVNAMFRAMRDMGMA